jgi:hypothetical protein
LLKTNTIMNGRSIFLFGCLLYFCQFGFGLLVLASYHAFIRWNWILD